MTMFERLERLEARMGLLEAARVPSGPPEHQDLVALDRHFDARCDRLSQRVDALESRLPNPIPLRPLKSPRCPCQDDGLCTRVRGSADSTVLEARSCFERWRSDRGYNIDDCERDIVTILARARVAPYGP